MTVGLIFDLDGTLIDSEEAICTALQQALVAVDHDVPDRAALRATIGTPLTAVFHPQLGVPADMAERAIDAYRDAWLTGVKDLCRLYDGAEDCCRLLSTSGYQLAVSTAKIANGSINAVSRHGLEPYFLERVFGVLPDDAPGKTAVTKRAATSLQHKNCEQIFFIGDALSDAKAAQVLKIPFIWCRYGYGPDRLPESLKAAAVITDIRELPTTIESLRG